MDVNRRSFLFGLLAAGAATQLALTTKAVVARAQVLTEPFGLPPPKFREIFDIMMGYNGPMRDRDFVISARLFARHGDDHPVWIGHCASRSSLRWVSVPGEELVVMPGTAIRLDLAPPALTF